MTDWVLIACLQQLRHEFDVIAPGRSKASDGSIGDPAHQRETSDHNPDETGSVPIHDADSINEVHAIDVTAPITGVRLTMEEVVQFLLDRCRSGLEKRLRYIIYNRRIWQAKNGWRQENYTGPSAHTEHAHFSASYESALEASRASWGLIEEFGDDMALDTDDKNWLGSALATKIESVLKRIDALEAALPQEVWDNAKIKNAYSSAIQSPAVLLSYAPSRTPILEVGTKVDALSAAFTSYVAAEAADDAAKGQALAALRDSLAALAPSLIAGVQQELEANGGTQLTQEMANTAFESALRNVFSK